VSLGFALLLCSLFFLVKRLKVYNVLTCDVCLVLIYEEIMR
jgi:hypothetical protein